MTFFLLLMKGWVGRKRSESPWQWNATNLGFDSLFYDCCLFPDAIHFLFIGGTIIPFGFFSFIAETSTSKYISYTSPFPYCFITISSIRKSNFENCPEVLGVQKHWFLFWKFFLWGFKHGDFIEEMNIRDICGKVTSLLLKWCWMESLQGKDSQIVCSYNVQIFGGKSHTASNKRKLLWLPVDDPFCKG